MDAPPTLYGRDAVLALLRTLLDQHPVVALHGPPGVGKTVLARAAQGGAGGRFVEASLCGAESPADALRALGAALGAWPSGDERTVLDALRRRAPVRLLLDDVAGEVVVEHLTRTVGGVSGVTALLVLESEPAVHPTLPVPALPVPPLDPGTLARIAPGGDLAGADGIPLLAQLTEALEARAAELPVRLARELAAYAAFVMGVPGPAPEGPLAVAFRDVPGRAWLRRGVLARVHPAGPARAAALALPAVGPLLDLATGSPLPGWPDPLDILLLRRLAELCAGPAQARCVAAAARLLVVSGQVDQARLLLQRGEPGGPERALLAWADGDALLAIGDVQGAEARWREAAEILRRGGDRSLRALVLRRGADRLAVRGEVDRAEALYRLARTALRSLQDGAGVAATLRGAADLATAAGELVSAATLLEQVEVDLGSVGPGPGRRAEAANLGLSQATLALRRGELARAERLLSALGTQAGLPPLPGPPPEPDAPAPPGSPAGAPRPTRSRRRGTGRTSTPRALGAPAEDTPGAPLLGANLRRREADLLLRRGDTEAAVQAAQAAAGAYARLGEVVAQAASLRVAADATAVAGRGTAAVALYRRAIELQIGAQDVSGLRRSLEHLALVEEGRGNRRAASRRRAQARALDALLEGDPVDDRLPPLPEGTGEPDPGALSNPDHPSPGSGGDP